jgi:hypothetical protein
MGSGLGTCISNLCGFVGPFLKAFFVELRPLELFFGLAVVALSAQFGLELPSSVDNMGLNL